MPLSSEASRRFAAYVARTDPSNLDKNSDDELFAFVAWAFVHEPDALTEHFAYEHAMNERGFADIKKAYVHTVIATASAIIDAFVLERSQENDAAP
jgi:hypothetical protein